MDGPAPDAAAGVGAGLEAVSDWQASWYEVDAQRSAPIQISGDVCGVKVVPRCV